MGRRKLWLTLLLVVATAGAIISYRIATQPIIDRRAVVGEPPPPPPPAANLVGKRIPRFEAVDLNGSSVNSDSLRGRPVIVAIWTTWCRPCREEMPRIEKEIWQKHRDRLAVIAIAGNEDAGKVRQFNLQAGFTFTLVPDPGWRVTDLFDPDGPIPRIYVVDPEGRIIHQSIGYSEAAFAQTLAIIERQLAQ